jgi:hypothetical protein
MSHSLFKNSEERVIAVTAAAGIALHGLLSSGRADPNIERVVEGAFAIADAFIAEAERRIPSLP